MKKIALYLIILLAVSSCQKDDLAWNLKRLSPKDAKLEVSEIIYSNNCSDQSGFQFIATGPGTPSSMYWDVTNNGFTGECFKTTGNCTYASIKLNLFTIKVGILMFYFKTTGLSGTNNLPSIKINSSNINTAIISGNQDSNGEWLRMQTEVLKEGNNEVEIEFNGGAGVTYYIDQIELWAQ
jgi:hypothetical protein